MSEPFRTMAYLAVIATATLGPAAAVAEDGVADRSSGGKITRWVIEVRGGVFEPDLELYEDFFDNKSDLYFSGAFGYRFKRWLELTGELGYFRDTGVGFQPGNNARGGQVTYTLLPAHIYANFRGEFAERQLFVPYGGVGVTGAYYRQEIAFQGDSSGRTDIGFNARAGVELNLNRLDGRAVARAADRFLKRSYLFIEAQYFSTEVDGIDLGGIAYLVGLRLEFDWNRDQP